jgi:D-alanyl-D-alanine carboxypeptidase
VFPSASVVKAMLLVTYLRQSSVRSRPLNSDDKAMLRPMIRWSDNDAATRVAEKVGERRINKLARAAHMKRFHWTRPWGLTSVTAIEQARFFFDIERYIPRRHEDYAKHLLSHVVPEQRWGIAAMHKPRWDFYFKGGWGSGTGWVNHQVGFFQRKGKRVAIAVFTRDSPKHSYASHTLRGVARRLLRRMPQPST